MGKYKMDIDATNLSSGFPTKRDSDQPALFLLVVSLYTILSSKRKTKALIRLRGCACWSAPLLFASRENRC